MHAFGQHLNMLLGDVEETATTVEIDNETYEGVYRSPKWIISVLFGKMVLHWSSLPWSPCPAP